MRGISLEQIVAVTKIGRRLLLALEEEQFDLLPGGIFNKSYVRAYAKCVGMNEDEAVALYQEASKEPPPDAKVIAHQHSFHSDRLPDRSSFPIVPVLILLVVAAGAAGGWKIYQDHRADREQRNAALARATTQAPATPVPVEVQGSSTQAAVSGTTTAPTKTSAATTPAGNTSAVPPGQARTSPGTAASPAAQSFEVTISPKGPAWVSVKADGQYAVRGIIKPPDVKTVHATGEVVFFTGNAGAIELSFNGKRVPLEGGSNTEQVVVFNAQGVLPRTTAP